jgi:NADH dehydrogenase
MSAIGADPESSSLYARSKGRGEIAVRELMPQAVITRASVIFGPDDSLFNRFATLASVLPVLPLIGGGGTKFQPVFVGDVAAAIALILDGKARPGVTFEFGGPEVKTLRELMQFVCNVTGRKRALIRLPFGVASWIGRVTEIADVLTLGILPSAFLTTRDQVRLLRDDNLVSPQAEHAGLILPGLGITPTAIETIVPAYLIRFRKTGQFDHTRIA